MESCSAMFHNSLLVILSFQLMLKIRLKQLLMKTWILRCSCLVVLQVSDPYSSTDFTLELKIFSLVCLEMILDFHNLFKSVLAENVLGGIVEEHVLSRI